MRKLCWFSLVLGSFALAGTAFAADFVAAPLRGSEEEPARDTNARGNATFELSADGLTLSFKLIVANIDNVVAAHIHVGPPGVNGPVVFFLYGTAPPGGGRSNGILSQGSGTAATLVGPLAGHPLSDLIAAMSTGNAYVNVHTNDGVNPPNTGPGDFPGGEIRSQVRVSD